MSEAKANDGSATWKKVFERGSPINDKQVGQWYWKVEMSAGDEIYFQADRVIVQDGTLLAYAPTKPDDEHLKLLFAMAPGSWTSVFATNLIDGSPIMVSEHWSRA